MIAVEIIELRKTCVIAMIISSTSIKWSLSLTNFLRNLNECLNILRTDSNF